MSKTDKRLQPSMSWKEWEKWLAADESELEEINSRLEAYAKNSTVQQFIGDLNRSIRYLMFVELNTTYARPDQKPRSYNSALKELGLKLEHLIQENQ